MHSFNNLRRIVALLLAILLASPALQAGNRRADKLFKEGQAAEARHELEKALELYEKAYLADPTDTSYQIAMRRGRYQASQQRVEKGRDLRKDGKFEEALKEFQKAYALDPSSSIAEQELRRTYQMIERDSKKSGVPAAVATKPDERTLTAAQLARKDLDERVGTYQGVPELKPISRQISSLKMNNQPARVLFDTVAKLAGINAVYDPDYLQQMGGRNFSLDLNNTSLEDALDNLALLTKSYWKALSANTIFVTQDNVQKRRDFEDHVIKVFYLQNVTSVQELNEVATAIRSVVEARRMFVYNAQNAILMRGTADQVAMVEKLINDLDKPKSEVVVEVIVMEANRARTRDLALALLSGGTAGLKLPVSFTGGTATTSSDGTSTPATSSSGAISLAQLGKLSEKDFSVTMPSALLQAMMSDRMTRVQQTAQVRAVDNVKADLRIGDRYPYATGSFQSGIGGVGVGVSPLVSTQFQFAEVGVNVSMLPKVHSNDEISMHIELEVSSVRDRIDIGGLSQPVIGQRKMTHDIRVKEGEITLMGGLMQTQDIKSRAGIPGLSSIPILNQIIGTNGTEKNSGELMIALVPHIVRSPEYTESNLKGIASGTDQSIRLSYNRSALPLAQTPAATPAEAPAVTAPVTPAPEPPPAPPAAPAKPPAPPAPPKLVLTPAAQEAKLGSAVTVTLSIENATDLFSAPLRLKFDPKVLRLNEVTRGPFLGGDGQNVIFTRNIQNDTGEVSFNLSRLPGSGGLSGGGALVTLVFQAAGAGAAKLSVTDAPLRNSQMQPIATAPPEITVTVK